MEIKYQFFEKECLLIQKFKGLFSFEDYLRYTGCLSKDFSLMAITKVLIDFRDLIINDVIDELPSDFDKKLDTLIKIRKKINQKVFQNKEVNLVIWVDKPLPTVVAHLFVNNFSKMNYHYCSTTSAVIEILKIDLFSDNLEIVVDHLENTFSNFQKENKE
jgi:hypothetical protein